MKLGSLVNEQTKAVRNKNRMIKKERKRNKKDWNEKYLRKKGNSKEERNKKVSKRRK